MIRVMLQVDDVVRMVTASLCVGIAIPATAYVMSKGGIAYGSARFWHAVAAVFFFIEMVRRHTAWLSWALNVPLFVAWVVDRFFWCTSCGNAELDSNVTALDHGVSCDTVVTGFDLDADCSTVDSAHTV